MAGVGRPEQDDAAWIKELQGENVALHSENATLREEIERLGERIAELEHRLRKGSRSSSLPPSLDRPAQKAEARRSRAERRAEERKAGKEARRRGKQPGAPGEHLARRLDPDEVVVHDVKCCSSCGKDLSLADPERVEVRQVFDVPDPRLVCTEHRVVHKRCACGVTSSGRFPSEARAPTSYGANVRAMALYLLHAQHLPIERTKEAMAEMLGVEVSTGFLASLAPEAAGGLTAFIEELKKRLFARPVVHVDETSDQVRTDTFWFHVVADAGFTYLFCDKTRGKAAPDAAGVLPGYTGVMMHDRLSMYFRYKEATHAICGAHLIRDLASVAHRPSQLWAKRMRRLLLDMNDAARAARDAGRTTLPRRKLKAFLSSYDALVEEGLAANRPLLSRERNSLERESYNLVVALRDLRAEATRFASDLSVPFTNNEAERSLRMAKLHHKISGCFQSEDHARHFAVIRSYLATARKHGLGGLHVLGRLFRDDAWMPPATT
ncbi:MAG: IS66 family transposase [Acidimicrobiales bacterium]